MFGKSKVSYEKRLQKIVSELSELQRIAPRVPEVGILPDADLGNAKDHILNAIHKGRLAVHLMNKDDYEKYKRNNGD